MTDVIIVSFVQHSQKPCSKEKLKHLSTGEYLRMSMSLVIIFTHNYKLGLGVSWHIATNSGEKYWIAVSQWAVRGRKNMSLT